MTITGALVLFAVIWFMSLLIALQMGLRTHGDEFPDDKSTPAFTPTNLNLSRKLRQVTLFTVVVWVPICGVIMSGWVGIEDIDIWGRMRN